MTLSLNAEQLAALFTQLHHLESAGLPCDRALSILLRSETRLRKPLLVMKQQVNAGIPVSEAGFTAGIFNDTQKTLLEAAEASGQLVKVYHQLANYYTNLASRIKKIKSRLYPSILILSLALFIQPIPNLFNSSITVIEYLQLTIGRLFIIGLTAVILLKLPKIFRSLGIETIWHFLQFNIPIVQGWIIKRQINQFFFILAIMLDSGVVFSEALPKAVISIKNTWLQKKFDSALALLSNGNSVTETLSEVSVIDRTMLQIIATGEQSGKLASSISHFTRIQAENISLQDDALAEWSLRLIYAVIAAWMAYSIFSSSTLTAMRVKMLN